MANICKAIMTPRNGGNNEAAAAGRGFAGDQTWVSLLAADLRTQSCFCDALATPTWKQNNVDIRVHFWYKNFPGKKNNGKNTSLSFTK